MHEQSEVIVEGDIVVDKENVELTTMEVLDHVGVIYPDDEFDLNHQF